MWKELQSRSTKEFLTGLSKAVHEEYRQQQPAFRLSGFCREKEKKAPIIRLPKNNNWPRVTLKQIIDKVFTSNALVMRDLDLEYYEFNILYRLLSKKFKNMNFFKATNETFNDTYKKNAIDRINEISTGLRSSKRVEENNKFVFKMMLNSLKSTFLAEHKLRDNKMGEQSFYRHYFKESALQCDISLDAFFDPLYRTKLKNRTFKSINSRYLRLLMQSEIFRDDIIQFFRKSFEALHKRNIGVKLDEFILNLHKFTSRAKSSQEREKLYIEFEEELERKKKFKIPWTLNEAVVAMGQFKFRLRIE